MTSTDTVPTSTPRSVTFALTSSHLLTDRPSPLSVLTEVSWRVDPDVPVRARTGLVARHVDDDDAGRCGRDERAVFTAATATRELLLLGTASFETRAHVEGPRTFLVATLLDRAPNGALSRIASARVPCRGDGGEESLRIELGDVVHSLLTGHALELDLHGEVIAEVADARRPGRVATRQRILLGGLHGARLTVTGWGAPDPAH